MIKLPNLDDKRFCQILDEAVARIPTLTDEWSDYNPQDTGIMLLELLAAMTEQQNFYLDQVGDRFYENYLKLVTSQIPGETTEERIRRFARESAQSEAAVTLEDYERLVLQAPFSIEQAKAQLDGEVIRITVLRGSSALTGAELEQLRAWLEPYRLLTARLRLEQAQCVPVDLVCRVVMDHALGRESLCREKLEALFHRLASEQPLGGSLGLEVARLEILSMREILQIDELSARADSIALPADTKQGLALIRLRDLTITITGQGG